MRKHMGYLRYDTEAARLAVNAVYADLRLLQNLFLPSVKLQAKESARARRAQNSARPLRLGGSHRREARTGLCPGGSPRLPDGHAGGGRADRLQDRAALLAPAAQDQNPSSFGNSIYGATKRGWVTLIYGSTGPARWAPLEYAKGPTTQTGLALHTEAARCTFSVGREVKSEIPVDEHAARTGVKT